MISRKKPVLDVLRHPEEKSLSSKAMPGSTKNAKHITFPPSSRQPNIKVDRRKSSILYGLLVLDWIRRSRLKPIMNLLSKFRTWKNLGFRSMRNILFRKNNDMLKDSQSANRRLSLPKRTTLAAMSRK
jgi:hypothetical protein